MEDPKKIVWEPDGTEAKTSAGTARRHRKPLSSFRWTDIKLILSDTWDEWYRHRVPRLGASLAFYTVLSLAPLLVVVIAVAGLVFGEQAARGQIVWQIQDFVGTQSAQAIQSLLDNARRPTGGVIATILGLATLFFGATAVVAELRDALNTIWGVEADEGTGIQSLISLLRERFFSFAMVLGVGFLLLVSLLLSAWLSAVGTFFAGFVAIPEFLTQIFNSLVSFFVITGLFALILKVMPDIRLEWRDVILGAAVTSLLFTGGKLLIGLYFGKTNLASSYGAVGSLVLVLVWVYYSSMIFFLGAEFTQVFANRYGSQPGRAKRKLVDESGTPANSGDMPSKIVRPSG